MTMASAAARRLIVNADDFGLSAGVNAGIMQAHKDGILTSATLLANAPAFRQAVEMVKAAPELGIGVHLNLVRGVPLSPSGKIPALVDERGKLRRFRFRRCTRDFLAQAEVEYRAQIEKALAAGIRPDHVDFEKHHAWQAPLYLLAARLAEEYRIPAIRNLREPVLWALRQTGWPGWKNAGMAAVMRASVQLFGGTATLPHPRYFLGQTHIGRMDERAWLRLLDSPPVGVSEIMTHPGLADPEENDEMGGSWLEAARGIELAALISPRVKNKLIASGVETCRFSDIC